ncbi:MAG: peptide-methionine (S)-S-oxide reductase MsrA [Leptospiraceae bacterium]|nr:peptide-methionine (S)-S-oxide reductase MsrA [Leptospiraceae bacterium]
MNKSIIVGGGCFWCTEAIYQRVEGVISVESGYAGGHKENPTYKEVCSESTGHAEVVKIEYDQQKVSLAEILKIFFETHNPTTLNKQGADEGTQYRSVIFYNTDEEKQIAEKAKENASKNWKNPIVTEITPFTNYYKAEDYHQNYFNDNPGNGYCNFVVRPKVEKFMKSRGE